MRPNHQANGHATLTAQPNQATENHINTPASAPGAATRRRRWRWDGILSNLLFFASLALIGFVLLPRMQVVLDSVRAEELRREQHERVMAESRQRTLTKQGTTEANAEMARKLSEENLKLAREINERLRKGE